MPTAAPTEAPASPAPIACSDTSTLTVAQYMTMWEAEWVQGQACFGSREVSLIGFVDEAPGIGFEPPGIEPAWLWFAPNTLFDRQGCGDLDGGCPYLWVHVNPNSDLRWDQTSRWVLLTGHAADPLAATCRYVYPPNWTEAKAPDTQAQQQCRSSFVLTSIEDAALQ